MPFGLSNAPASFQGYVNKFLAEKLDIFFIVYLDDILIYTEDPGKPHVEAVRWVLDQLCKHGQSEEVSFLSGRPLGADGEVIGIVGEKNWLSPKALSQARSGLFDPRG